MLYLHGTNGLSSKILFFEALNVLDMYNLAGMNNFNILYIAQKNNIILRQFLKHKSYGGVDKVRFGLEML